ncbi:hypothetical protein, partial [Yersinia pestis]|uniref:hypothetical protein n=2 Tax=Yersinia pestis TaxID=632 RepID=UPI001C1E0B47
GMPSYNLINVANTQWQSGSAMQVSYLYSDAPVIGITDSRKHISVASTAATSSHSGINTLPIILRNGVTWVQTVRSPAIFCPDAIW